MASVSGRVRLAELVATISLGTDLGLGQPMEHVIKHTLASPRMAELLALDLGERTVACGPCPAVRGRRPRSVARKMS